MAARPYALVVDDNPMVLRAMSMLLDSVGWGAAEASSGVQALELIGQNDFDLAIIDLKMPDINGIELCRQILSQSTRKPPILFLHSGYIEVQRREEALRLGIHEILNKPIGRNDLITALRKFGLPSQD